MTGATEPSKSIRLATTGSPGTWSLRRPSASVLMIGRDQSRSVFTGLLAPDAMDEHDPDPLTLRRLVAAFSLAQGRLEAARLGRAPNLLLDRAERALLARGDDRHGATLRRDRLGRVFRGQARPGAPSRATVRRRRLTRMRIGEPVAIPRGLSRPSRPARFCAVLGQAFREPRLVCRHVSGQVSRAGLRGAVTSVGAGVGTVRRAGRPRQ